MGWGAPTLPSPNLKPPWQELDVDLKYTNRESPEELGSPLVPTWSLACPSCCLYSRLCGLQRLRVRAVPHQVHGGGGGKGVT